MWYNTDTEVFCMKTVSRLISAAALALLLALLRGFAKSSALVFVPLWQPLSEKILSAVGSVTGAVAFPVWEAVAALLLFWLISTLIHSLRRVKLLRWLSGVLLGACVCVFLFMFVWGVGMFVPGKTEKIVTVKEYTIPELRDAAMYYGGQAAALAASAPRDADGNLKTPTWEALEDEANDAFERLAAQYPEFSVSRTAVKKLFPGKLFRHLGADGVFSPFTAEAGVNPDAYAPELPAEFCHVLAHRFGAYTEEDAAFCAYLACAQSSDPFFRYSGSYAALMSCYRALRAEDPALAAELWDTLPSMVQADILGADAHDAPYRGAVQETAQKVTAAYLNTLEQQGVRSYGRVSDALIAHYQAQKTAN